MKLGPSIFLVALVPLLMIEDSPAPNALFTFTVPVGLPSGLSIAPACPHILPPEEARRAAISSVKSFLLHIVSSKKIERAKIEEGQIDSFLTLYCPRATASNFEEFFEIVDIEIRGE